MSGPIIGSTCQVCHHPQVTAINALLTTRQSTRSIAASMGVNYSALRRHKANHVPGARSSSRPPVAPPASGSSPADIMRSIVDGLAAVDVASLSPMAHTRHIDAYRRAVESLAKMEPPTEPKSWRIVDIEGLPEMFGEMLDALDPYPAALKALAPIVAKYLAAEDAA